MIAHPIHSFAHPSENWCKLAAWGWYSCSGAFSALIIGANWRCWAVGVQWWRAGLVIHLGPLTAGIARVEAEE